jgi:hypothetical protein
MVVKLRILQFSSVSYHFLLLRFNSVLEPTVYDVLLAD